MVTPKPDVQLDDEDITQLDLDSEELPPVLPQGSQRSRSSGSQSVLSLTLDPDLLRGVSAAVALSGWCKHWSSKAAKNVHHLSRPVHAIDTFLSHDWETSRWTKLLTLLMVLNSRASAVAGLLTSILVGILRITHILPDETWTVCFVYIALFSVLCFWQRIRSLFPGHQMVFLDKLCINQMDSEKKQQGILGLGAFVLRSKKLLVLWSPRYFTRMWCTYEIGCFLSHGQTSRRIEILPVKLALILIPTALLWHSLMIGFHLMLGEFHPSRGTAATPASIVYVGSAMLLLASGLLPTVNYLGMGMMREVQELPRQLENFEVQKAECFCCSHHHRHPQTGEEMICDRELIYETLQELYHSKSGEDALAQFNRRVQERLRPKVLGRIGGEFPLRYIVCMVLVSNLPFLSELMSNLNKGPPVPLDGFDQAIFALRLILLWVHPCLSMLFSLKFSQWIWRIFNFKSSVCYAICTSPLISLAVACTWISMEVMIFMTPDNSMLPILVFLAVFALDAYLYVDIFNIFKKSAGRQSETSFRDTPPSSQVGDGSLAVHADLVCDKWEIEEDGGTLVTWKF